MYEQYEFLNYVSTVEIEKSFQSDKAAVIDEMYSRTGIENPSDVDIRVYWADHVQKAWRSHWGLEWLYERSGRPVVENLDTKTLTACCSVHLDACLLSSYENCDLVENNKYRRCPLCLPGQECPQCYNERLNHWRPI